MALIERLVRHVFGINRYEEQLTSHYLLLLISGLYLLRSNCISSVASTNFLVRVQMFVTNDRFSLRLAYTRNALPTSKCGYPQASISSFVVKLFSMRVAPLKISCITYKTSISLPAWSALGLSELALACLPDKSNLPLLDVRTAKILATKTASARLALGSGSNGGLQLHAEVTPLNIARLLRIANFIGDIERCRIQIPDVGASRTVAVCAQRLRMKWRASSRMPHAACRNGSS